MGQIQFTILQLENNFSCSSNYGFCRKLYFPYFYWHKHKIILPKIKATFKLGVNKTKLLFGVGGK